MRAAVSSDCGFLMAAPMVIELNDLSIPTEQEPVPYSTLTEGDLALLADKQFLNDKVDMWASIACWALVVVIPRS